MHLNSMKMYLNKLLFSFIALFVLSSCNKEDKPIEESIKEEEQIEIPYIIDPPGCYVQSMLSSDLENQYTFDYSAVFPSVLERLKSYNSTTGNVNESYRFQYFIQEALHRPILDTVFKYLGDIDNQELSNWHTATVYNYFFSEDNNYEVINADVYVNDPDPDSSGSRFLLKGTINYTYDDYNLLTGVEYIDNTSNSESGTEADNYRMVIIHDTEQRFRELHYYNSNDIETYYEVHTPSAYYQPTQLSKIFHPDHGWMTRFAPQTSIYWTQSVGIVSYNYEYQLNDKNYVVEQTWNDGFNTYTASLFNYHCFD